jgi:hypothetical protein
MRILIFIILAITISSTSFAQSFSCTPERVTFASNGGSVSTVEETKVNWSNIVYHISGETAVAMTYKNPNDISAKINPKQTDELTVIQNSENQIVMLGGKFGNPMWMTTDVIFPKDGNGYSFYVSDYPKSRGGELINLSKLYMLKCKEIVWQEK